MDIEKQKVLDHLIASSKTNNIGCLLYLGNKDKEGYGRISFNGKKVRVHRLIMHLKQDFNMDSELLILHKTNCPNKHCFEESHLYIGDRYDNRQDYLSKKEIVKREKCCHGHILSEDNVYKYKGKEFCRTCRRISVRKADSKRK